MRIRAAVACLALACLAVLCGCASTATRLLEGRGIAGHEAITQAFGAAHAEVWGVHFVATFTWLPKGETPPPAPYLPVGSIGEGEWALEFRAPETVQARAASWYAEHWEDVQRQFAAMIGELRAAYPSSGARRFRIVVLPPGSRFDGAWPQLLLSDRSLLMTFAVPLPDSARPEDAALPDLYGTLAHEFSHSYFWFHPELRRNNFSDEVVAYVTQRCVAVALAHGSYEDVPEPDGEFLAEVNDMRPRELYRRYHERHPDTYLAAFAAASELRRARARGGSMKDYCRAVPTAGTDFTTD